MLDERTSSTLERIVRREGRSLIQYACQSYPWITEQEQLALNQLRQIASEERQAVAELGQLLVRRGHVLPRPGPYPESFMSFNYISLEHLFPMLVEDGRQALAQLEQDASQVADSESGELLTRYVDLKRQHLKALEILALANPEVASTRR